MTRVTTLAVALILAVIGPALWAQKKGTTKMAQSQTAAASERVFVERWFPNPKGPNPFVPRLDTSSIGPYDSLAQAHGFGIAEMAGGRLAVLEEWARDREGVSLDTAVAGGTLADMPLELRGRDAEAVTPLFFMMDAGEGWRQVDHAETQGETTYVRLRAAKDLTSDALLPIAERITQYHARTFEYYYNTDGTLAEIVTRDRADNFEPKRQVIAN